MGDAAMEFSYQESPEVLSLSFNSDREAALGYLS